MIKSVKKTNRLLIVEECHEFGGCAAEIAMQVQQQAFDELDAPIERITQAECPLPYAENLEAESIPLLSAYTIQFVGLLSLIPPCATVLGVTLSIFLDNLCAAMTEKCQIALFFEIHEILGTLHDYRMSNAKFVAYHGRGYHCQLESATGDKVSPGLVLAEVQTDKTVVEWESLDSGVLAEIVVIPEGDVAKVNMVAALLTSKAGEDLGDAVAKAQATNQSLLGGGAVDVSAAEEAPAMAQPPATPAPVAASPAPVAPAPAPVAPTPAPAPVVPTPAPAAPVLLPVHQRVKEFLRWLLV